MRPLLSPIAKLVKRGEEGTQILFLVLFFYFIYFHSILLFMSKIIHKTGISSTLLLVNEINIKIKIHSFFCSYLPGFHFYVVNFISKH